MALLCREAMGTGRGNPGGVLTALAVANQTIAVVGPLLGGLLTAVGGRRATFALNVPPAVAAVLLGMPRPPASAGTGGRGPDLPVDRVHPAVVKARPVVMVDGADGMDRDGRGKGVDGMGGCTTRSRTSSSSRRSRRMRRTERGRAPSETENAQARPRRVRAGGIRLYLNSSSVPFGTIWMSRSILMLEPTTAMPRASMDCQLIV
ncbi:hypothetical protein GCM10018793_41760 [Streptomyces sulfonofaciens]|uniref:MFS transporter n=1 Tax=Streptomyces sulfonofaciens TaxID=68272 RepID=A0A919GD58_9ACTN|nr:hypothetical protein GCM10018793_41760 [Streptomyces sulfonofaciens]